MVGMCLYTPPCLYTPLYVCTPPVCLYTPICSYTPWGCTPPGAPHVSVLLHGFGTLHVVGGVVFLFYVYWDTPPLFGGASPFFTSPHTLLLVLCALLFSGISVLMWAFSPSIEGFGGVPPSLGEVGVTHQ